MAETCWWCGGSGYDTCPECGGSGVIRESGEEYDPYDEDE